MFAGSKIRILLADGGLVLNPTPIYGPRVKCETLTREKVRDRWSEVYAYSDNGHVGERLSRLVTRIERNVWSDNEAGAARAARSDEFIRLCAAEVFGEEWAERHLGNLRRKEVLL